MSTIIRIILVFHTLRASDVEWYLEKYQEERGEIFQNLESDLLFIS